VPLPPTRHPEIIAHRGTPREHVENSLAAFDRALSYGVDGIELDVHATSDGVVVVHHDPTLRASVNDGGLGGRAIASISSRDLQRFRLDDGSRVPTLLDVCKLVGDRATVYVEIKGRGIEQLVADTIVAAHESHATRCAVHSFDHRIALRMRTLAPELPTGVLLSSYLVEPVSALLAAGARDLWQHWDMIDDHLVERVHAIGGRVIAWTINEPGAARHLASLGVDGLCTDLPRVIQQALVPTD
jgi:glycerophosphoryl diester phosphodiesterase